MPADATRARRHRRARVPRWDALGERGGPAGDGEADRGRSGPRPFLRLRAAQQRQGDAVRGRLARPLPSERAVGGRRPRATAQGHRRSRRARRGCGAVGRRSPRRRRLRLPDLARLRLPRVAVAVPLGTGRSPALVSLRRGRVREHRGGDPGGARAQPPNCPSRWRRCATPMRPGRWSRRRATRSSRAARRPSRGAEARSSSTTRPAARTHRWREPGRFGSRWMGASLEGSRSRGRGYTTLHPTPATRPIISASRPTPGSRSIRSASQPVFPESRSEAAHRPRGRPGSSCARARSAPPASPPARGASRGNRRRGRR